MSKYWQGPPISVFGISIRSENPYIYEAILSSIEDAIVDTEVIILVSPIHIPNTIKIPRKITVFECKSERFDCNDIWDILQANFNKKVVVLTQGAPLFYNVGSVLRQRLPYEDLIFHDAISNVQYAFTLIGQPYEGIRVIDLRNKPLEFVRSKIEKNCWYAVLSDSKNTPQLIAKELLVCDLSASEIWVFERLGCEDEQITYDYADALAKLEASFVEPNMIIMHVKGEGSQLPQFMKISDDLFAMPENKQLFFKSQARLNLLSFLFTNPKEVGWVVGAGYGEIAIEWAKCCPQSYIHAVEYVKAKGKFIYENQRKFGLFDNLSIHIASAPPILDDIDAPDVAFVNIDAQDTRFELILDVCWERIRLGGRVIAVARNESTKVKLFSYAQKMQDIALMQACSIEIEDLVDHDGKKIMQTQTKLFIACWHKKSN